MSNLGSPLISNRETQKNVKSAMKSAQQLPETALHELIKIAVDYLCNGTQIDYNSLTNCNEANLSEHEFKTLFQNLIILLRNCCRYRSCNKQANLAEILSEELRLPKSLCQLIQSEINSIQMNKTIPYGPKLPSVRSIKWRIDVVIASNVLSKVLEPLIVFEMITDSGEKVQFHCNLAKFNQLRLTVATALGEFYRLEEKKSAISR